MKLYANLHLHSIHSDGVYTPAELVRLAKEEGYGAISITDHDTATAYPELKAAAEELGIEYLFGVEFSVQEPKEYHIVGFNFDPEYPPMKKYLSDMSERERALTEKCFAEGLACGSITGITWQEVIDAYPDIPYITNNHVFSVLKAKGLKRDSDYFPWVEENFREQAQRYQPLHDFLTLHDIVKLIKAAGGFAVVAHPHQQLDDIDYLISEGIEGLEVWHTLLTPEERERALSIALEKGLFISGGSDHEGVLGGYYSAFSSEEELKATRFYTPPMSTGTTKEYFEEIKSHKINR